MDRPAIRTLKPNVTQKDALRAFSAPGFSALYWRLRIGPLQKIADAYVPFWLYRVRYQLGRTPHARLFALDAVDGSLDLFELPRIPELHELISVDSRNRMVPSLTGERAEEILREKVLRVVSSKDSSSFAKPVSISRGSRGKCIFPIGSVFTAATDRCAAA